MHILCLLCPIRSTSFQNLPDLPSSSRVHIRVHLFPAPRRLLKSFPVITFFLPRLFLAYLCSPRFCVFFIFFILSRDLMLLVARKDTFQVYIVLFIYLVVLARLLYVDDYQQIYVLYITSFWCPCIV